MAAVAAALVELYGRGFEVASAVPSARLDELLPGERAGVAGAVPRRQAQYSTGRICARHALRRLGVPDAPLLARQDRSPAWPDGVVGSISHTDGCCAAVVGRASRWLAVGLDVERDIPLDPKLERRICTASESQWLAGHDPGERGALAKIFFSAKEAVYKCQHPLAGLQLGFQDVELELDAEHFCAVIAPTVPVPAGLEAVRRLSGRFRRVAGFVLSGVAVPSQASEG